MNWKPLSSQEELQQSIDSSFEENVIIFKHSTACPVSAMAKKRLESDWNSIQPDNCDFYFLDLIRYRALSNDIASHFGVRHESPQALLIQNGKCVFDASHQAIKLKEFLSKIC